MGNCEQIGQILPTSCRARIYVRVHVATGSIIFRITKQMLVILQTIPDHCTGGTRVFEREMRVWHFGDELFRRTSDDIRSVRRKCLNFIYGRSIHSERNDWFLFYFVATVFDCINILMDKLIHTDRCSLNKNNYI